MKTKKYFTAIVLLSVFFSLMMPAALAQQTAEESTAAPQARVYSQEELDRFLAPVALYPDALLSQILMASTYPLEVVEADRWLQKHQDLTGDALDQALLEKTWDVSVKSLCRYPRILATMSDSLSLTNDLGNAFLAQQDQVMDTIQKLRAKARDAGNLSSTDKQKVMTEDNSIVIEPASPEVIYVPAYDPCWVYGPWWYPVCTPLWFWYPHIVIGTGFFFGPPIFIGPLGPWCGFRWHRHEVFVDFHRTIGFHRPPITGLHGGRENWVHNPVHRRGIGYQSPDIGRRFGDRPRSGVEARRPFRGFGPEGRGPGSAREPRPGPGPARSPGERQSVGPTTGPGEKRFGEPSRPRFEGREMQREPRGSTPGFSGRPQAPAPRSNVFEGFGTSGSEVRQQRDRGFNSMGGASPRSPGGFRSGGDFQRRGGFQGGGREGGHRR